jgi:hypothetical protein
VPHDEAVDVDAVFVLAGVELQFWGDWCHAHRYSSLENAERDRTLMVSAPSWLTCGCGFNCYVRSL